MKTVVVVENNKEICEQIEIALNGIKGIKVVDTAEDGEDGILKIHRLKPDIVITDIKMPKVDGIELIRYIAENSVNNYIPHFIVITSETTQTIEELRNLPIRKVFNKPFSYYDLIGEVIKIQKEERVRVLIADDDKEYCEKLKNGLSEYDDIDILGIANTDEDEILGIKNLKPDIVITDLIRDGKFTGKEIIEKNENVNFLVISYTPYDADPSMYKNVIESMQKFDIEKRIDAIIYRLRKYKANAVRLKLEEKIINNEEVIEPQKKKGFMDKIKSFGAN